MSQASGYCDQLFHGVIRVADNAGGQEEALDIVALVEVEGETDHLIHCETGALHIAGNAIDAIFAVKHAVICQENFQKGYAAPVGGVAVAYAVSLGRADARALTAALGAA